MQRLCGLHWNGMALLGAKLLMRKKILGGWRPRQESNLYLALRRRSFYPLNYGGRTKIVSPGP